MQITPGATSQAVGFAAWTTATGEAVTITSTTAGLSLWYRRGSSGAKVALTPVDLASVSSPHTAGGVIVIEAQEHRLDLPDAAFVSGVSSVEWGGSATGITIDGGHADLVAGVGTTVGLTGTTIIVKDS